MEENKVEVKEDMDVEEEEELEEEIIEEEIKEENETIIAKDKKIKKSARKLQSDAKKGEFKPKPASGNYGGEVIYRFED